MYILVILVNYGFIDIFLFEPQQNPLQPELNVSRNVTIEETHKIIEAFKTTRLTEKVSLLLRFQFL